MGKIFKNWDQEKKSSLSSYNISDGTFNSYINGLEDFALIGKNIDSGINNIEASFKFKITSFSSSNYSPVSLARTSNIGDTDAYFLFFIYTDGTNIKLAPVEGSKYDIPSLQSWFKPSTDITIEVGKWYYLKVRMSAHTTGSLDGTVKVWINNSLILDTIGESIKKNSKNVFWIGGHNLSDINSVTCLLSYDNFQIYNLQTEGEGTKNLASVPIGNYLNTTNPNYLYSYRESVKPIVWDDFTNNFDELIWQGGTYNASTKLDEDYIECTLDPGSSYITYNYIDTSKRYKIYEVSYDMLLEDLDLLETESIVFNISKAQYFKSSAIYNSDTINLIKPTNESNIKIQFSYFGYDSDHHYPPIYDSVIITSSSELPPIGLNVWNKYKFQIWCSDSYLSPDGSYYPVGNGKIIIWVNDDIYIQAEDIKTSAAVNKLFFDFSKLSDPPSNPLTITCKYRNIYYREIPEEVFGQFFYPSVRAKQIVKDTHRSGEGAIFFGDFGKETRHDIPNADFYLEAPYPYIGSAINPIRETEYRKTNTSGETIGVEDYVPKDNAPGINGLSAYAWIKPDIGGGTIFEMAGIKEIFAEQPGEGGGPSTGPPGGDYHFYPDSEDPANPQWFNTPKRYFEYYAIHTHKTTDRLIVHDRNPGDTSPWGGSWYEPVDFLGVTNVTMISAAKIEGFTESIPIIDGSLGDLSYVVQFVTGEDKTSVIEGFLLRGTDSSFTGDVVVVNNSDPVIIDCEITGNTNNKAGISAYVTDMSVYDCVITNNSGGGIDINGIKTNVEIFRSVIKANTKLSSPGNGAGISATNNGKITVHKCSIINNKAYGDGGGVRISTMDSEFINCNISGNESQNGSGGGIFVEHLLTNFKNCIITNCTIVYNTLTNSSKYGCGIRVEEAVLADIQNSIVYFNSPFPDTYQVHRIGSTSYIRIEYSDIEGGQTQGTFGVQDYSNNKAVDPDFDYGIVNHYKLLNTSDCQDAGLSTVSSVPSDDYWGNPRPYDPEDPEYTPLIDMGYHELQEKPYVVNYVDVYLHLGDSIQSDGIDIIDPGGTVRVHDDTGGSFPSQEYLILEGKSGITIEVAPGHTVILEPPAAGTNPILSIKSGTGNSIVDGFIIQNAASGGAVSLTGGSPTIRNCTFIDNTNTGNGGSIYCNSTGYVKISNCVMEGGAAQNGGEIYIENSSGEIVNCVIGDATNISSATYDGGGICWKNDPNPSSSIIHGLTTSLDCSVTRCEAGRYGGGIYLYNASPTIRKCDIYENSCYGHGAGIYIEKYTSGNSIDTCNITQNHNLGTAPSGGYGGGCYLTGTNTDIIFVDTDIKTNDTTASGGGIFVNTIWNIVINKCSIDANIAVSGGGLHCNGVGANLNIIGACTFNNNDISGTIGSGIVAVDCSVITISDGITVNCSAVSAECSAVELQGQSTETKLYIGNSEIKNCNGTGLSIIGNCAGIIDNFYIHDCGTYGSTIGGGLDIISPLAPLFIIDTIVWSCNALHGGGARIIYDNKSSVGNVNIIFSVFHENSVSGNGAGIYAYNAKSKIKDCIIYENNPTDVIYDSAGTLETDDNLVGVDPYFSGLYGTKDFYHINESTSPAIDTGKFPDLVSDYPSYPTITAAAIGQAKYDFDGTDERSTSIGATVHIGVDENDLVGSGRVWRVGPGGDFATVQAGINDAVAGLNVDQGDTLEVLETYVQVENINVLGQRLTIRGEAGKVVYLNGNHVGSCITFNNGETSQTVLRNLRLINGIAVNGGGIHIDGASPTIDGCYIGIQGNANAANGLGAEQGGGGIYCKDSSSKIINTFVQYNDASRNGGGILAVDSDIQILGQDSQVCVISHNSASAQNTGSGGGIAFIRCDGAKVDSSNIGYNDSHARGGGIYAYDSDIIINNCFMQYNYTTGAYSNNQTSASGGGAIFMSSCNNSSGINPNISNNTIVLNTVGGGDSSQTSVVGGGGIYLYECNVIIGALIGDGNTIGKNVAYGNGGGIFINKDHTAGAPYIGSNIIGKTTTYGGPNFSISNVSNHQNRYWGGGGLFLKETAATIESNDIYENRTNCLHGAGIAAYDFSGTIQNNEIRSNWLYQNTYGRGGGYSAAYESSVLSPALLYNNFVNNISEYIAGGAYLVKSIIFNGNTVSNNSSTSWGGGIYIRDAASINYNKINNNTGSDGAGCVLGDGPVGISMMTGNMIYNNEADHYGGGILFIRDSSSGAIKVINNTIIKNKAGFVNSNGNGGGVGSWGTGQNATEELLFANNIFYSNDAYNLGDEIYIESTYGSSNIVFDNNQIGDISGFYGAGTVTFDNPIIGNPELLDLNGNNPQWPDMDFNLTSISPCIGLANDTYSSTIPYDFHYNDISLHQGMEPHVRFQPEGPPPPCDIGADEHADSLLDGSGGRITIKRREPLRNYRGSINYLDSLTGYSSTSTYKISSQTWPEFVKSIFGRESLHVRMKLEGFMSLMLVEESLPTGLSDYSDNIFERSYFHPSSGYSYFKRTPKSPTKSASIIVRSIIQNMFGDFGNFVWTSGISGNIRGSSNILSSSYDRPFIFSITPVWSEYGGTDLRVNSFLENRAIYDVLELDVVIQANPSCYNLISAYPEVTNSINTYGELNKIASLNSDYNSHSIKYSLDWDASIQMLTQYGTRTYSIPCILGACMSTHGVQYSYKLNTNTPTVNLRGQNINVLVDIPVAEKPNYIRTDIGNRNLLDTQTMWETKYGKDDSYYLPHVKNFDELLSSPVKCFIGRDPDTLTPGEYPIAGGSIEDWDGTSTFSVDIYIETSGIWDVGFDLGEKTNSTANFDIGYTCRTSSGYISSENVFSTGPLPIYVSTKNSSIGKVNAYISAIDLKSIYTDLISKTSNINDIGNLVLVLNYVTIKGIIYRHARVFSKGSL